MKLLSKALITVLITISMLSSASFGASLEQVKKTQVQNTLKTTQGKQIMAVVEKYSLQYHMDPYLIHAIILTESGYRPMAKSPCGATGLMQLMPTTFKARGFNNIYSIDENVHAGVKHLAGLNARYKGNIYLALAAYNAGGGYVDRYNGEVPANIKGYVNKVFYHKSIIESVLL